MPDAMQRAGPAARHSPLADVRGASRLVIDLTLLVTGLVETMHHNIARAPGPLGTATLAPTRGITGLVYRSVRGITRLVGGSLDLALAPLVPLLTIDEAARWVEEHGVPSPDVPRPRLLRPPPRSLPSDGVPRLG